MATRSRGTSGRKKEPAARPPLPAESTSDDSHLDSHLDNLSESAPQRSSESDALITRTHLERREIPSFSESREARIAEAAYWRAEQRGFAPGGELDDWLAAERDIRASEERDGTVDKSKGE